MSKDVYKYRFGGRFASKKRTEEERIRSETEEEIQKHWTDNKIRLKELIWENVDESDSEKNSKHAASEYVVFIDTAGDLDWIVRNDISNDIAIQISKIMYAQSKPCKFLQESIWMAYKRMLGAAIVSALSNDCAAAEVQLNDAVDYINKRITECSRFWSILTSTILIGVAVIFFQAFRNRSSINMIPFVYGALGAYISIIGRFANANSDASALMRIHCLEALIRLTSGMILGGMFIWFCSTSLAPEFCHEICTTAAGVRILAFAAGLFDWLMPSIISKYVVAPITEKKAQEGRQNE